MIIDYPFEYNEILRKKKALIRQLSSKENLISKRVAILSGATIGDIKDILEIFLLNLGIKPQFYIGQYQRFYEEILFQNNEILDFKPDIIYIHTTVRNLSDSDFINKLKAAWAKIKETFSCPVIQNNFELPDYFSVAGCLEINNLNIEISDYAKNNNDFYINDIQHLSARFGLDNWFDEQDYFLYKYAFSVKAVPLLCHNISKIIASLYGRNKKCLVLDLDNTVWGGIVGEVGCMGIELGPETALGEAYISFQKYIKMLHDRGIILAVCSKNDEAAAKEAFKNPNMILKLEDIAVFCANWNSKAENIDFIARRLNILPESIVFVDDNPAERELVERAFHKIKVLKFESVIDVIRLIEGGGYFYSVNISGDDLKRNEYYASDTKRDELRKSFIDYGEYLSSLQMRSIIQSFIPENLDRITQLINKTNQFNLTTKRYTLSEIESISADSRFITLYATIDDKFGANGIVSALIGEADEKTLHIRLWVMSCRVFKRDLELAIFDSLVDLCKEKGLEKLVGYYIKTDKNSFVSNLYENLGFNFVSNEVLEYDLTAEYQYKNKYIKIEKGNI